MFRLLLRIFKSPPSTITVQEPTEGQRFSIEKDLAQSNWSTIQLSKEQIEYVLTKIRRRPDAVASLQLYQALKVRLEVKREEIGTAIPEGWYTFNSRLGDLTRTRFRVALHQSLASPLLPTAIPPPQHQRSRRNPALIFHKQQITSSQNSCITFELEQNMIISSGVRRTAGLRTNEVPDVREIYNFNATPER
ncbi:hypothetical protein B0H13DRAFT_1901789 [Mycena leptocephala]|nr:hypothetical protein B0H13DRAFT_1901789 [Mycena leptocephala]